MSATQQTQQPVRTLHDLVELLLHAIDRTDGEITPELECELAELTGSLELKVEGYGAVCAQIEAEAEATVQLSKRYAERAQIKLNAARRLKERLRDEMQRLGVKRLPTSTVTATIQPSTPSVRLLVDDGSVPDQFCVQTRTVSKSALKDALKANDPDALKVAALDTGFHLRFR